MFDYPDWRLDKDGSWVRLRDEGDKVTLTYKHRLGKTLDSKGKVIDLGMEEIEIEVSDFEKTDLIFQKMGFIIKRYTENKRERWKHDGATFDLDTYPLVPTYLEIEAPSWKKIDGVVELLKLNPKDKKIFSAKQVYETYGIDENDYDVITFDKLIKKKT